MWPTRLRMADDLAASGVLKGRTRAEVRALLGEDDASVYDRGRGEMVYLLGPGRSLGSLDIEPLHLRFGPDGRASDWHIQED